jgi:hypothetical protein
MPNTARSYGLAVTGNRDDRLDLVRSTVATARYLRDLYHVFGDWPLTLAAYNTGENRVQHAVERYGTRDFWNLSQHFALVQEIRRYVLAVLALAGDNLPATHPTPPAQLVSEQMIIDHLLVPKISWRVATAAFATALAGRKAQVGSSYSP